MSTALSALGGESQKREIRTNAISFLWHLLTAACLCGACTFIAYETPMTTTDLILICFLSILALAILVAWVWWASDWSDEIRDRAFHDALNSSSTRATYYWSCLKIAVFGKPASVDVSTLTTKEENVLVTAEEMLIGIALVFWSCSCVVPFALDAAFPNWLNPTNATIGSLWFVCSVIWMRYVSDALAFRLWIDAFLVSALGFIMSVLLVIGFESGGPIPFIPAYLGSIIGAVGIRIGITREAGDRSPVNLIIVSAFIVTFTCVTQGTGYSIGNVWLKPGVAFILAWFAYWVASSLYESAQSTLASYGVHAGTGEGGGGGVVETAALWVSVHAAFLALALANSLTETGSDIVGWLVLATSLIDIGFTWFAAFRKPNRAIDACLACITGFAAAIILMSGASQLNSGFWTAWGVILAFVVLIFAAAYVPWFVRMPPPTGVVSTAASLCVSLANAATAFAMAVVPHGLTSVQGVGALIFWAVVMLLMGVVSGLVSCTDMVDAASNRARYDAELEEKALHERGEAKAEAEAEPVEPQAGGGALRRRAVTAHTSS